MSKIADTNNIKFGNTSEVCTFASSEIVPFAEQIWERVKRQETWTARDVRSALFFLDMLIKTRDFTRVEEVTARVKRFHETKKESLANHQLECEIKFNLARVLLMQGDIPGCLGLVSKAFEHISIQNAQGTEESVITLGDKWHLLGSKLELLCGEPDQALERLLTLTIPVESSSKVAVLNNLGCLHFRLGRLGLAQLYFTKSIGHANKALAANNSNDAVPRNISLSQLLRRQRAAIIYNVALSSLHSGDCENALDCFQKVCKSLSSSPYIWIRMAECCLNLHNSKLKGITDTHESSLVESHVEGSARGDIFFLPRSRHWHEERLIDEEGQHGLNHAVRWLQTAIGLCRSQTFKQNSLNAIRLKRLCQTAVLKLCYCLLCLQRPEQSNLLSSNLLKEKDLDATTHFLASIYTAEALCMVGQAHQASQYLKYDANSCRESKVPDALSLLFTNLATVYVLRQKINTQRQGQSQMTTDRKTQATQCLQKALSVNKKYGYGPALRLLLYLQLQGGHVSRALHLIKFRQVKTTL